MGVDSVPGLRCKSLISSSSWRAVYNAGGEVAGSIGNEGPDGRCEIKSSK